MLATALPCLRNPTLSWLSERRALSTPFTVRGAGVISTFCLERAACRSHSQAAPELQASATDLNAASLTSTSVCCFSAFS